MFCSLAVDFAIGTALGFLAGLGVGGGSLLILWLTLVRSMDSLQSRGVNLLFFLPCALITCFFRVRQGALPFMKLLPGILSGCLCAAVCSLIGARLEISILKKLFSGLLLITGVREILYKPRE